MFTAPDDQRHQTIADTEQEEIRLFLDSVLRSDRSVLDLLTSDVT